jgi:hypothetical protein
MELQQDWKKTAKLAYQINPDRKDADACAAQVFWELLEQESIDRLADNNQTLRQLRELDGRGRSNQGYFVGRLLELRGRHEAARHCYQLSVAANEPWQWNSLLSQRRLDKLRQ